MTLTYSIHQNLRNLPKSKAEKAAMAKRSAHDWQAIETSWFELAERVSSGQAIAPVFENGYRSNETFEYVQFVALDFDDGTPLVSIAAHPLCKKYMCILGATARHTREHPRSRLIFASEPIMSRREYDHLWRGLFAEFAELKPDPGANGAARFFLGLKRAPLLVFTNFDRRLAVNSLGPLPVQQKRVVYSAPPMAGSAHMLLLKAVRDIEAQRDGSRNTTLNRWAYIIGKRVKEGVLDRSSATAELLAAALRTGLEEREILSTINSAFSAA